MWISLNSCFTFSLNVLAIIVNLGLDSNMAVVVLPPNLAVTVKAGLDLFREFNVGLWCFNPDTGLIRKIFQHAITARAIPEPKTRR